MSPQIMLPSTTSPKAKDVRDMRNSIQFLDMATKKRALFTRTSDKTYDNEKQDEVF